MQFVTGSSQPECKKINALLYIYVCIYVFPNLPIGSLQKTDYILWLVNSRADISGELQTAVIL